MTNLYTEQSSINFQDRYEMSQFDVRILVNVKDKQEKVKGLASYHRIQTYKPRENPILLELSKYIKISIFYLVLYSVIELNWCNIVS